VRALVIDAHVVFGHPGEYGSADAVGLGRLQAAALHGDDLVRARTVEAADGAALLVRGGILRLVAVAVQRGRAGDRQLADGQSADARERVQDALLF
jgi:hypothetical protein